MENANQLLEQWIKLQQNTFDTLLGQAKKMQSIFEPATPLESTPFAQWFGSAQSLFADGLNNEASRDLWAKSLSSHDALMQLYRLWEPILAATQKDLLDPEALRSMMSEDAVKRLIDQFLQIDPDLLRSTQSQLDQYQQFFEQYGKPWLAQMQKKPGNAANGQDAAMAQFSAMLQMLNSQAGKLFSTPAVGKDREQVERWSRFGKALTGYAEKTAEYQQLMHETGQDAMRILTQRLYEKQSAGEAITAFEQFFSLWIEIFEQRYNQLFRGKAFSQKRNAMTDAGFEVRRQYQALLETQLKDFPVARRSEMDELYKIIYDLRKQVKSLESRIKESS